MRGARTEAGARLPPMDPVELWCRIQIALARSMTGEPGDPLRDLVPGLGAILAEDPEFRAGLALARRMVQELRDGGLPGEGDRGEDDGASAAWRREVREIQAELGRRAWTILFVEGAVQRGRGPANADASQER